MKTYSPLYVPKKLRPPWYHWLLAIIPLKFWLATDAELEHDDQRMLRFEKLRTAIAEQLSQRPIFPVDEWNKVRQVTILNHDPEELCLQIARTFGWSNHHFLPSDSTDLLFLEDFIYSNECDRWANASEEINFISYEFGREVEQIAKHLSPDAFDTPPNPMFEWENSHVNHSRRT